MKRYLENDIHEDLQKKMVFVGGARQVGKTTLALDILGSSETHPAYLNWDLRSVKKSLLAGELPGGQELLIFDEIHKYKEWRNLLKGFYDTYKSERKFLVTGSARLDYYRRSGDSLQGRYYFWRLHPLSLHELNKRPTRSDLEQLLEFGGFPEPFLEADKRNWKRWQRDRQSQVIREDVLSLEHVKMISQLDLLSQILPDRVGSPLSINNLRQDLSVAFETADNWIHILENLYYCFRVSPYGVPALRAAKKEKKLYLWDWSLCENSAARFENLVASHLLKYCHYHEDRFGDDMTLHFLRDSQKREIDFVVCKNRKPVFAVECKSGDSKISRNISYFAERAGIPFFYQVHMGRKDVEIKDLKARILPFTTFCRHFKI